MHQLRVHALRASPLKLSREEEVCVRRVSSAPSPSSALSLLLSFSSLGGRNLSGVVIDQGSSRPPPPPIPRRFSSRGDAEVRRGVRCKPPTSGGSRGVGMLHLPLIHSSIKARQALYDSDPAWIGIFSGFSAARADVNRYAGRT